MKKLILFVLCTICSLSINAQTEDKKWNIGLHGGATQYKGDLGNDFYKGHMPFYGFGGISVSRYIVSHFDINLLATKGKAGYNRENGYFLRDITTATLNFRFNILGSQYAFRPYIFIGGGAMLFDKDIDITEKKTDFIAPSFGGGINLRLGPSVMLNLQETFLYTNADNRDGIIENENDAYLLHMVGLTFNFGKKKDMDKDGISDRMDKCPDTPSGIAVDSKGCPLDKDNDGIADYLDACPSDAGVASLKGCPDKDGDGITDKDDKCPDNKGSAALNGCPDADNDGIADINDKCADTKSGYKVDATGCPMDTDNDGIINEDDQCPDKTGPLALKGCPDSDGDGVSDFDDRCPMVIGTLANKGCPEITKEDIKKITQIASKIFFETNSDKLKVASLVQLDELSDILKRYDAANLIIEGHTDSQGEDDYNFKLSQKRTESVKIYLIEKGIADTRLTATGFGETNPIADNKTAIGRAKNRRVELKTSY